MPSEADLIVKQTREAFEAARDRLPQLDAVAVDYPSLVRQSSMRLLSANPEHKFMYGLVAYRFRDRGDAERFAHEHSAWRPRLLDETRHMWRVDIPLDNTPLPPAARSRPSDVKSERAA